MPETDSSRDYPARYISNAESTMDRWLSSTDDAFNRNSRAFEAIANRNLSRSLHPSNPHSNRLPNIPCRYEKLSAEQGFDRSAVGLLGLGGLAPYEPE